MDRAGIVELPSNSRFGRLRGASAKERAGAGCGGTIVTGMRIAVPARPAGRTWILAYGEIMTITRRKGVGNRLLTYPLILISYC
jgi:hypothetical protein